MEIEEVYMMARKKVPCVSLILLLVVSTTLISIPHVSAQLPILSLNPMEINVSAPGQSFLIDVNVTAVTNLKGFEFKLDYNTTILNATLVSPSAVTQSATKWLPIDANMTFHWDGPPTINDAIGRVWIYGWGFSTYNGSGVLVTVNFTATAVGNSTLHLYEDYLYDNWADEIAHTTLDGSVTVIPEFPAFIITPLLIIGTLAAAFLGKRVWSRKRKDTPTAG
jgi:hypothetical protein